MPLTYLFRRPPGHIFLTTEDPTYRYEVLCGHCDYPIEACDPVCPRCQRQLVDCPVCRHHTHKKAPKVPPHPRTGAIACPVCRIQRLPFGRTPLSELHGSYCPNLYGCPAGGLLLRSDELAVLPEDASMCPVCRHPELRPLPLRTFLHHIRRCLFCSTIFGVESAWSRGWSEENLPLSQLATGSEQAHLCAICGRCDRRNDAEDEVKIHVGSVDSSSADDAHTHTISASAYLRVAELGRMLALEPDDRAALNRLFDLWFDNDAPAVAEPASLAVSGIVELLLRGTTEPETRLLLQIRLDRFLTAWPRVLGVGTGYRVPTGGPPSRPTPVPDTN